MLCVQSQIEINKLKSILVHIVRCLKQGKSFGILPVFFFLNYCQSFFCSFEYLTALSFLFGVTPQVSLAFVCAYVILRKEHDAFEHLLQMFD